MTTIALEPVHERHAPVRPIPLARRILAADSAARVLVLTTFGLDEYVYEALRAGASGFVLKDDPPSSSSPPSASSRPAMPCSHPASRDG